MKTNCVSEYKRDILMFGSGRAASWSLSHCILQYHAQSLEKLEEPPLCLSRLSRGAGRRAPGPPRGSRGSLALAGGVLDERAGPRDLGARAPPPRGVPPPHRGCSPQTKPSQHTHLPHARAPTKSVDKHTHAPLEMSSSEQTAVAIGSPRLRGPETRHLGAPEEDPHVPPAALPGNFVQCIFDVLPRDELSVHARGRWRRPLTTKAAQTIIRWLPMGCAKSRGPAAHGHARSGAVVCGRKAYGGIILKGCTIREASRTLHQVQHKQRRACNAVRHRRYLRKVKGHLCVQDRRQHAGLGHLLAQVALFPRGAGDGEPTPFEVEVVDPTDEYTALMKTVFDFAAIKELLQRSDFTFVYDALSGIAGPYAHRIFAAELGVAADALRNCTPLPDFGGHHPDPNLTYAAELVKTMGLRRDGTKLDVAASDVASIPTFGAAADGDADRNMILGRQFFVTPSDSVAIIAAHAAECIPYFRDNGGVKALARSMPTSMALDLVAKELGVPLFEFPTGWKFFGTSWTARSHSMDYTPLICGEESLAQGVAHSRKTALGCSVLAVHPGTSNKGVAA